MYHKWRAKGGYPATINLTTGDQVVLPADPKRCAIWIDTSANTLNINFGQATTGNDFTVTPNGAPFVITRDEIGDLITHEVHARASVGYTTVWFVGQEE